MLNLMKLAAYAKCQIAAECNRQQNLWHDGFSMSSANNGYLEYLITLRRSFHIYSKQTALNIFFWDTRNNLQKGRKCVRNAYRRMAIAKVTAKPACINIRDPCIKVSGVKKEGKLVPVHCYEVEISTINLTVRTDYVRNKIKIN